jgi:hypothetical protein
MHNALLRFHSRSGYANAPLLRHTGVVYLVCDTQRIGADPAPADSVVRARARPSVCILRTVLV